MLGLLLATLTLAQAAPPETTIVSGPPGVTTNASPTFAFTSSVPAAFQCSLDDADFAACVSPFTAPPLGAGAHTFAVRAVDAGGQADPTPATASFQLELPVSAMLRGSFTHDSTTTGIKALTVRRVPTGGRVSVSCRGGGCPFRAAKTFKARHHVATLTGAFKKARMRNHARIEISVAAAAATTKVFRVTFRKPPRNPGVAILCQPPGAAQPSDCGSD